MKRIKPKTETRMNSTKTIVLGLAGAGLILSQPVKGQGALNLTAFKGNYKGTVLQTGPSMGNTASGRATVGFKVPRSGTSAKVSYVAAMPDGMGGTNLLPTAMTLKSKNRLDVTDLLVGIAGTNNAKPGSGDWLQRKRTLKIDATNGEGITLTCKAVARDLRNKRKMSLILVSNDGVDTTTFATTLKARLPRRN